MYRTILGLVLIFAHLLLYYYFFYTIVAIFKGAAFVPTSSRRLKKMIELAEIKPSDTVVDFGSGDGRILNAAAKTGAACIGIEINPLLYLWSILSAKLKGLHNVSVRRADLWKFDLTSATVLMLYFTPPKMNRLEQKIKKEMKPGSRVISSRFKFENWKYAKSDGDVYLYIV